MVIAFQDGMYKAILLWLHFHGPCQAHGVDDIFSVDTCIATCTLRNSNVVTLGMLGNGCALCDEAENEADGMFLASAEA